LSVDPEENVTILPAVKIAALADAVPGAMVPPLLTVIAPLTVPFPPRVPVLPTVTALGPVAEPVVLAAKEPSANYCSTFSGYVSLV
jgi:hypothetical protein